MKHSESLAKLAPAMAKAQAAMGAAKKESKGNYGKYADLASVWEACEAALEANKLAVLQGFTTEGTHGSLWTMLLHESGEYVVGVCPLVLGKLDPQGIGSATTYYRRYGLAAMLGITQEDDDGQRSMPDKTPPKREPEAPKDESALQDWAAKMDEATTPAEVDAIFDKIPPQHKGPLLAMKGNIKRKLSGGKP